MGSFFNDIRRNLFGWLGREFLIFLFFLAVAGIFWLLTTLNDNFEQELKMPVRLVNVPKNVVITSGEDDTLRVTVRDKGISLITYLYKDQQPTINIDFNRYARADGSGSVPASDLLRLADMHLPASAQAIGVKPDAEHFTYNNGERKKVPVAYRGKVEPDMRYFISDIHYSPDSVTIYASERKLDSIAKVYTEPIQGKGFRDSLVATAQLQGIDGVKMVPNQVMVAFYTDMLTEVSISDVPVVGINMPEGKVLRTFPSKLSVSFVTGMKSYQHMTAADFLIVADYNELGNDSSAQCNVYLRQQPADIQRVRLERNKVDYLIEVRGEK